MNFDVQPGGDVLFAHLRSCAGALELDHANRTLVDDVLSRLARRLEKPTVKPYDEPTIRAVAREYLTDVVRNLQERLAADPMFDPRQYRALANGTWSEADSSQLEGHVVLAIVLAQPDFRCCARAGCVMPETRILLGKRSRPGKWGEGTWAPPMGAVEVAKDLPYPEATAEEVLVCALRREIGEEVREELGGGDILASGCGLVMAGSYEDIVSGITVHLAVVDLPAPLRQGSLLGEVVGEVWGGSHPPVATRNAEEHARFDWHPLERLPMPMHSGTTYALAGALGRILELAS